MVLKSGFSSRTSQISSTVTGVPVAASKVAELTGRIDKLKARLQSLAALEAKLAASGENQISLTDPNARAMTSKSHSTYTVGYNVRATCFTWTFHGPPSLRR